MQHEPCGFLRNAYGAMNLIAADSVFAIANHPHCQHPLVQRDWTLFKNRSGFASELALLMMAAALPAVMLRLELDVNASAIWAANTFRPAASNEVFPATVRIGEINHGLLQRLEFFFVRFHVPRVPELDGVVKYIIALPPMVSQEDCTSAKPTLS